MRNQIVILAAGKGTRMGGDMPKVLVMLKNKPLVLYILEEVEKINQLVKPIVVVGYMAEKVKAVLGDGYIYALQYEQLGTGHAVKAALQKVTGENILVLYGDMPFIKAESLKELMRLHQGKQANVSMLTAIVNNFENEYASLLHYGRIIRNQDGEITKITEYKDASDQEKNITEVNPGIYMFNTSWLNGQINKIKNNNIQGEYYLTDIIEVVIQQGALIQSLPIEPKEVIGINSREELEKAGKLLS